MKKTAYFFKFFKLLVKPVKNILVLSLIFITLPTLQGAKVYMNNNEIITKQITKNIYNDDDKFLPDEKMQKAYFSFTVDLIKKIAQSNSENIVISPFSVAQAVFQAGCGANGRTLKEFEQIFNNSTIDEINNLMNGLNCCFSQKSDEIKNFNSMWINDDLSKFEPSLNYVDKVEKFYRSQIYTAHFVDGLKDIINEWVEKRTNGKIKNLVDEINSDQIMMLVNAVAFESNWEKPYDKEENEVMDFCCADGQKKQTEFLSGKESYYIEDENSIGFIKPYFGKKYAFFTILPNGESSVNEYIATLTQEKLRSLLSNEYFGDVYTLMPKFTIESSFKLNDILKKMGLEDAFDFGKANFSLMGHSPKGNIYIGNVKHKAYISVDEVGTKAYAATQVDMCAKCCLPRPVYITLDKPFLYGIVDTETHLPLFVGVLNNINN